MNEERKIELTNLVTEFIGNKLTDRNFTEKELRAEFEKDRDALPLIFNIGDSTETDFAEGVLTAKYKYDLKVLYFSDVGA